MSKKYKREIKALPFLFYFWPVVILVLAGISDAVYLSISHYRVYNDIEYSSFCAISKDINCDTVAQSPYSIFWGIPVAVWGVIGYFFFFLLLLLAKDKAAAQIRIWPLLFLLSLLFSLYSIVLALISIFYIRSLCIMCILSYAISFLLLYTTWIIRNRFKGDRLFKGLKNDLQFLWQRKVIVATVFFPFLALVITTKIFYPVYWSFEPPRFSAQIPHGMTRDGHPWVGAENADLVITEFTDYQCFQCNKMHFYLRQLLASHPGKFKIVHRHFPMDHSVNPLVKKPIHRGSGSLAMLAIYAGNQDKFWQMSDLLFGIARKIHQIDIAFLAETTGLETHKLSGALHDPAIRAKLNKDIVEGLQMGVRGTPTFVINNELYRGQIPAKVLSKFLD